MPRTQTRPRKAKVVKSTNPTFAPHPKIKENEDFLLLHFMEWIGSHLCDCSRVFNGDLTEMLVLTVIGQMFVRHHSNEATRNYSLDGEVLTVSIAQISEATSIPRETVRRKLFALQKRGWISQTENGGWTFNMNGEKSYAHDDLRPLQMRSLTRLLNLTEAISKQIQD